MLVSAGWGVGKDAMGRGKDGTWCIEEGKSQGEGSRERAGEWSRERRKEKDGSRRACVAL